jgi:hypothetical protein
MLKKWNPFQHAVLAPKALCSRTGPARRATVDLIPYRRRPAQLSGGPAWQPPARSQAARERNPRGGPARRARHPGRGVAAVTAPARTATHDLPVTLILSAKRSQKCRTLIRSMGDWRLRESGDDERSGELDLDRVRGAARRRVDHRAQGLLAQARAGGTAQPAYPYPILEQDAERWSHLAAESCSLFKQ